LSAGFVREQIAREEEKAAAEQRAREEAEAGELASWPRSPKSPTAGGQHQPSRVSSEEAEAAE